MISVSEFFVTIHDIDSSQQGTGARAAGIGKMMAWTRCFGYVYS